MGRADRASAENRERGWGRAGKEGRRKAGGRRQKARGRVGKEGEEGKERQRAGEGGAEGERGVGRRERRERSARGAGKGEGGRGEAGKRGEGKARAFPVCPLLTGTRLRAIMGDAKEGKVGGANRPGLPGESRDSPGFVPPPPSEAQCGRGPG